MFDKLSKLAKVKERVKLNLRGKKKDKNFKKSKKKCNTVCID